MPTRTIAAIVIIETEDERLFPERVATRAEMAQALMEQPSTPAHVVALMDASDARAMLAAHVLSRRGLNVEYLREERDGAYVQ